jgi:hypothetical protein
MAFLHVSFDLFPALSILSVILVNTNILNEKDFANLLLVKLTFNYAPNYDKDITEIRYINKNYFSLIP